ncbi:MAG: hypothetical protein ACOC3V_04775 [bacterium]
MWEVDWEDDEHNNHNLPKVILAPPTSSYTDGNVIDSLENNNTTIAPMNDESAKISQKDDIAKLKSKNNNITKNNKKLKQKIEALEEKIKCQNETIDKQNESLTRINNQIHEFIEKIDKLVAKIKEQEKYKDTEIYKREISRLVVDKEYRKEGKVLFGLFRIIEELTKDKPTMMCTSRPSQINLYQAIGFERFGPNILYSLEKEWAPLIRRHWYAHNRPEQIEGMCKELHEQVTEPFPLSDIDKWNSYAKSLAKENIKGFYQEKNGI